MERLRVTSLLCPPPDPTLSPPCALQHLPPLPNWPGCCHAPASPHFLSAPLPDCPGCSLKVDLSLHVRQ